MTNPSPQDVERMIERLRDCVHPRSCARESPNPGRSCNCIFGAAADMLAALSAIRLDEEGWQPIETAPKDGTEILGHDGSDYSICARGRRGWVGMCDGNMALVSQGDTWTDYIEPVPTHWRPLPKPPRLSLEGGDDGE